MDLEAAKREEEAADKLQKDKERLPELTKNKIKFTITLSDGSVMRGELYPDLAPETVKNFVELANSSIISRLCLPALADAQVLYS
jgi:peptidyl-prolyl cis-trans isomerase B (cyclophilin B)